jgi:hypothetical protein
MIQLTSLIVDEHRNTPLNCHRRSFSSAPTHFIICISSSWYTTTNPFGSPSTPSIYSVCSNTDYRYVLQSRYSSVIITISNRHLNLFGALFNYSVDLILFPCSTYFGYDCEQLNWWKSSIYCPNCNRNNDVIVGIYSVEYEDTTSSWLITIINTLLVDGLWSTRWHHCGRNLHMTIGRFLTFAVNRDKVDIECFPSIG